MSNLILSHPDVHCVLRIKGISAGDMHEGDYTKIRSEFAKICTLLHKYLHVGGDEKARALKLSVQDVHLTLEASLAVPIPPIILDEIFKCIRRIVDLLERYKGRKNEREQCMEETQ